MAFAETITPYLGIDALTKYTKGAYRVYKAEVPVGTYELDIAKIAGDGYIVNDETMEARPFVVEVEKGNTTYVGKEKVISAEDFNLTSMIDDSAEKIISKIENPTIRSIILAAFNAGNGIVDKIIEVAVKGASKIFTFGINFPGVWLDAKDPGFSFKSVNYAGEIVSGTSFVMVNRDEMEKIIKASLTAGKETFENAMKILGDEESGISWSDLNLLNKEIVSWDKDANEIHFNEDTAFDVLKTYLILAYQSAIPAAQNFMSKETNIRLPAILKETADEEGVVHFTEDSNVTLIWAIDIIRSLMDKAVELGQSGTSELSEMLAESEEAAKLKAIVDITSEMLKVFDNEKLQEFEEKGAEFLKKEINTWVYPLLQNDKIPEKLTDLADALANSTANNQHINTEKLRDLVKLMPNHALLTAKMPAGPYLMFEISVPEGYVRNPVFYTINVIWDTSKSIDQWLYVNVANIGIIGPYFAESYYTFLRDNSLIKSGDKVINMLTSGKYTNLLEASLDSNNDISASIIKYYAGLMYNSMGASAAYESQDALEADLSKYLYNHGKNTQNLWIFANKVAMRRKDVITGSLDKEYWYFYNIKENLHTNGFDAIKAILNGTKDSLKEDNDTFVSATVKKAIDAQISIIEKADTAITKMTSAYTSAVKSAVNSVNTKLTEAAKSVVSSLLKRLFK